MASGTELVDWLLDTDPALRWQVERDLVGAPPPVWRATRARVAHEGFGAALLARQDPDGQWAGGAYFPAHHDAAEAGQPWTATTWSLLALREWGLDAAVLGDTAERLRAGCRWEYDDLPYWDGEVDCCINAWTIGNGAWLGVDVAILARWFVEHQLADGGWNCEWVEGAVRSSVHSTLNALTGLLAWEQLSGTPAEDPLRAAARTARHAGEEYLLRRRLRRRLTTGEPVGPWVDELAHPFRWCYSSLRALDHFRAAAHHDTHVPDPRLAEAVAVVRAGADDDGRWRQQARHPGRVWFEVDVAVGEPSRWLTFYATRVLRWWDEQTTSPEPAEEEPDRRGDRDG